ncbi:MAG: hypothetical protein HFJ09_07005 [Lachnospiraceae bacterium]|nr:hypothetical protein [Lachnospiraceae bacterium]
MLLFGEKMENKVCTINVIKSKIVRPDFFMKLALCIVLQVSTLYYALNAIHFDYQNLGAEKGNLLMYLLMVFTDPHIAYYSVLLSFAILVSDVVYEEYLTKNIYVMYGSRKKAYWGMIKLTAAFSLFFICLFLLLAVTIGICGGLDLSFSFTDNAIRIWAKDQDFYLVRSTTIYLPVSILKYNSLLVFGMVIFKYYVGLILLAMIGLVFSTKKDSVQYGILAIMLNLLLNIAVLEYYGPWTFYNVGISIDLSGIFSYFTLQRFFIYDFAGIKKDVVILFRDTILTGGVWFVALSVIIYQILKKKDI